MRRILWAMGLFFTLQAYPFQKDYVEKRLVVVVTSYNNALWVHKNLDSIFMQDYQNYRVIYIDDCSTDNTAQIVQRYIQEHGLEDSVIFIRNSSRCYKFKNIYNIYHSVDDWDIIVQVDGDDWLAHEKVFQEINEAYTKSDIWLTYGQFRESTGQIGYAQGVPSQVIQCGAFRQLGWRYMPLRTFYAWLFKQIKLEDFLADIVPGFEGKFFPLSDDVAFMFPMIEMARYHYKFFSDVLYIANRENPISAKKAYPSLMTCCYGEIVHKRPYQAIKVSIRNCAEDVQGFKTDCMIIVQSNWSNLSSLLNSMYKHVSGLNNIFVIGRGAYAELQQQFPAVHFLSSLDDDVSAEVKNMLNNLEDYVFFLSDNCKIERKIDCQQCIQYLEQTFADGFYLSLGYTNDLFSDESMSNEMPCQHICDDIYAWKYKHGESKKDLLKKGMENGLLRKEDLVKKLLNIKEDMLEDIVKSNKVGLFFHEPSVVVS